MPRPTFADDSDRFLPIWCAPDDELDMERIKSAKAALDLPYTVYPRRADKPGEYERILAVGTRPPYASDYALISARSDPSGVTAALAWVLGESEDPRATSMAQSLSVILRRPVREISDEELASEAALVAYLTQ